MGTGNDDENFQIGCSLHRLNELFLLQVLQNPANIRLIYYRSIFIEVVLELHYLLTRKKLGGIVDRVNFTDDIPKQSKRKVGYNDIVTIIEFYRNAICHKEDNGKRVNEMGQHIMYNFQSGLNPLEFCVGQHLCKYDDDIACVFGRHILYIKRHLEKLYRKLAEEVLNLPEIKHFKALIIYGPSSDD